MDIICLKIRQGSDLDHVSKTLHQLTTQQALYKNQQQKTLVHELLTTRNVPYVTAKQWIQYLIQHHYSKSENAKNVLSSTDDSGSTILHYACLNDDIDIPFLKELIDACNTGTLEIGNMYKWTPLHHVCNHGKGELVKFLLSEGCNKDAVTSFNTDAREIARLNMKDNVVEILDSYTSSGKI